MLFSKFVIYTSEQQQHSTTILFYCFGRQSWLHALFWGLLGSRASAHCPALTHLGGRRTLTIPLPKKAPEPQL